MTSEEMSNALESYSVLLVEPTAEFLSWYKAFTHGREQWFVPYVAEDNGVCLIPRLGKFAPDELRDYLQQLKPELLEAEVVRFVGLEQFPFPIDSETFDRFFAIELREACGVCLEDI